LATIPTQASADTARSLRREVARAPLGLAP
jgi:hypothetical protein